MTAIEDQLRGHYAEGAPLPPANDLAEDVVARGRRLQTRRRVRRAGGAAALALALVWGVQAAPGWDLGRDSAGGLVPAAGVPAAELGQHEAAIARYVEQHPEFSWIDDSGGKVICAVEELGQETQQGGTLRVYVWALCENRGGETGSATALPLVVDLRSGETPVRLLAPADGAGYTASIHENFPRSLWAAASNGNGASDRLRRQIDDRASKAGLD